LHTGGWGVLIVWECQTQPQRVDTLRARLTDFLS
jgi:G:T-mismatch repair DNA endonuclease (very short patch repair protein)